MVTRGAEVGGATVFLRSAMQYLGAELPLSFSMTYTNPSVRDAYRNPQNDISFIRVPMKRDVSPIHDALAILKLASVYRQGQFDIVWTHTSKGGFVGRAASRLAPVPTVIHTVHGFAFHERTGPVPTWCYSRLESIASRWCDHIVTVTEFHRSWAVSLGIASPGKITAIPNGIAQSRISAEGDRSTLRRDLGISDSERVILSVGRLVEGKGLVYLIDAFKTVQTSSDVPSVLLIAGDGPERGALEERVRLSGLSSKVRFLGFRSDVGNLYELCDLVVLPSEREGLSITLLEAMAAGKQVIASDLGGNREALAETGMLVPPGNSSALAQAIQRCMTDVDAMRKCGLQARKRYEALYTEQRMLRSYADLFSGFA